MIRHASTIEGNERFGDDDLGGGRFGVSKIETFKRKSLGKKKPSIITTNMCMNKIHFEHCALGFV